MKRRDRHQGRFEFTFPEHTPEHSPVTQQRLSQASAVLRKTKSREIESLLRRGQIVTGEYVETQSIALFVRDNRIALEKFVQLMAGGGYARSQDEQMKAWGLLAKIKSLSDFELALELEKLGLCESTESFGRKIGSFRYALFGFRDVMKKWREANPQIPPSQVQSTDSSQPHTQEGEGGQ